MGGDVEGARDGREGLVAGVAAHESTRAARSMFREIVFSALRARELLDLTSVFAVYWPQASQSLLSMVSPFISSLNTSMVSSGSLVGADAATRDMEGDMDGVRDGIQIDSRDITNESTSVCASMHP